MVSKKHNKRQSSNQRPLVEPLLARTMMSATPFEAVPSIVFAHRESSPLIVRHAGKGATANSTSAPEGLSPAQVRAAYGVNNIKFGSVTGNGAGQTIAIVDAYNDPSALSDLQLFDKTFGLPSPASFTKLNENGGTSLPQTDPSAGPSGSWAGEESLDVQWSHALAPDANIVLIEADSPSTNDLNTAVNTARHLKNVTVISMSYGASENSGETLDDSLYTTPSGHAGITFLASTGDSGAYSGPNRKVGLEYAAASPNVVAVGGTSLYTNASGAYFGEAAWDGTGGGVSAYESEPAYQKNFGVNITNGKRGTPDLAFLADPNTGVSVVDSTDYGSANPWEVIGGTSLACPSVAALVSIADQGRVLAGHGTLDGATQTLPAIYALPGSDFHDITTGSNGAFSARTGYDLVTGRGTPKANLFVAGLADFGTTPSPVPTPISTPTPTPTPSPTPTVKGTIVGYVYWDYTLTGNPAYGSALKGFTVYADLYHSGHYQTGDPYSVTNAAGEYEFYNVPTNTKFTFGVITGNGWFSTTANQVNVTVSASKPDIFGPDFGLDYI